LRTRIARIVSSASILVLLVHAAACNSGTTQENVGGGFCGYSLGFIGGLTGPAGGLVVPVQKGALLAIDQFNKEHGANCVTIESFDSQGNPETAPGLARDLVKKTKIIGVIGPLFSGETESAAPVLDEAGLPFITPSATNPTLAKRGWKTFHRAVANDDTQGPAAGSYIKNVLKAAKVYVADDKSAYGIGIAGAVKTVLGSLVVGTDQVVGEQDASVTDYSGLVQKVMSSGATVLFYGGYYGKAGLIRAQLSAAGWTGLMVAGDGVNNAEFTTGAGKGPATGTIVTCACAPATAAGGTFVADYKAAHGIDPGVYSDVTFDATNIFLKGIAAGNTAPQKLNEYLKGVNYVGAANTYKFTAEGDLDPSLVKVWAFKFEASGGTAPVIEIPKA
jgi:branched-chain amino acid transport system substrate-binding protein